MIQNNNYNLTENKNDSFFEKFRKTSTDNNPNKIFSLYNNFLIKENRYNYTHKNNIHNKPKEILPEYSNIKTRIETDKNLFDKIYEDDPIFKSVMDRKTLVNIFTKGFKNIFLGPRGLITKKSVFMKKYYKSLKPKKVNFHDKLFIGSMSLFDSLGESSAHNKRLKSNFKKMIQMHGNFDLNKINSVNLKQNKKNFVGKKLEISNEGNNLENNKRKNKRFSQFYKSHNLFLDYKNNLIQDNNTSASLIKARKSTRQVTHLNFLRFKNLINISESNNNNSKINNNSSNNNNDDENKNISQKKIIPDISNLEPIPNKNLFIKTFQNSKEKKIKNFKKEILKTEENTDKKNNKNKKLIEDYASKPINFAKYFKQKKEIKNYVNSFEKSFNKKLFSSKNSNQLIKERLNNFIIKKEKYVIKKNKYFRKKMQEPYNEFKEDSKNEEKFKNFAKNVDFSNNNFLSDKKDDKIKTYNMFYNYKVRTGGNIPVKEYLKDIKRKKEKEKENKLLKSVRLHFKANSKIIHDLTISLDDIKKKYNY